MKYSNPHICFDRQYWYLSVSYEVPNLSCRLTGKSIDIHLGIKDLAVCSNGKMYKNIDRSHEVRRVEKR